MATGHCEGVLLGRTAWQEKIKMSKKQNAREKSLCVGNNMRAKNSEYTCANSPLPCPGGFTSKSSPAVCCCCFCSFIRGRGKQDFEAVLADNDPNTWDHPQLCESWACCWPGGQLGSASLCPTPQGSSLRKS